MGAKFEMLAKDVKVWAEGKGIYDKSTPIAQLNGAIAEVYEFRESVIKELSRDEILMELGDVIVFMINYYHMTDRSSLLTSAFRGPFTNGYKVENVESLILKLMASIDNVLTFETFAIVGSFAHWKDSSIDECLEMALNKITKRNGKMKNGKFVKDGD